MRAVRWREEGTRRRWRTLAPWFMSSGVQQNAEKDAEGLWDEFSGLLTVRSSTALYNEMGAEMPGSEPAFNVSIHKMEGGKPQNCQLHLNKSVIKIK